MSFSVLKETKYMFGLRKKKGHGGKKLHENGSRYVEAEAFRSAEAVFFKKIGSMYVLETYVYIYIYNFIECLIYTTPKIIEE